MLLNIPVPIAEIFDKISILQIKLSKINDLNKRTLLNNELKFLIDKLIDNNIQNFLENKLFFELKTINLKLWNLCNIRRKFNINKRFDSDYIELSHQENLNNEKRALIKKKINESFDSQIREEKSFI